MLIYKITNLINKKVYIGLTTRTIDVRWKDYIRDTRYSKSNDKTYRPIIAAMQKYGIENFLIEVLENNISTKEELDLLEKDYILKYNSTNPSFGYNIELGGNSVGKHSENTKRKISEALVGNKNHMYGKTGELSKSSKKILDITTDITYVSVTDVAKQLNLGEKSITKISACARSTRCSAYGHVFRYLDSNNNPILVPIPTIKQEVLYVIDTSTNTIYESLQDTASRLHLLVDTIRSVCNKQRNSCFGHIFIFGEKHTITYIKHNKIYDLVLDKYKYLVNTVLSSELSEKV